MRDLEPYIGWLSNFFFAPGHDRDDLAQEARIAAWLAPEHPRLAARRKVLDVVKIANRRAFYSAEYSDAIRDADVVEIVEARERLREILTKPRNANERVALGRRLRGEPIRRGEHALDQAWHRLRERLAA